MHLQLILNVTGKLEGGSGSIPLCCSNILSPLPVDFTLIHEDKNAKTEGNKEVTKIENKYVNQKC